VRKRRPKAALVFTPHSSFLTPHVLVVARDGLHRGDDLFVRYLLRDARETSVFGVEKKRDTAVGVAPEGREQLAAFGFGERTEVHGTIL
jgi:hypothetical protein